MNVLIIALTHAEFQDTVDLYDERLKRKCQFHHITNKEKMRAFTMPLQIRFVGRWRELPDAPTLEWYAGHLSRQANKETGVAVHAD